MCVDLYQEIIHDIEDAIDIARAPEGELCLRAMSVGWTIVTRHMFSGRHITAMFRFRPGKGYDVCDIFVRFGAMFAKIRTPAISVCGGPFMFPIPTEEDLLEEFDLFAAANGYAPHDKPVVQAMYRALDAWFDHCF